MSVEISNDIVCPFCYQLMINSIGNIPTTLEPCHHVICSSCLQLSKTKCPLCDTPISSSTINQSVRTLVNDVCAQLGFNPEV